jgi:hypothetical protein
LRDCTYVGLQAKWQNVCTYTCRVKGKCHESHVNVDQFSCQRLTFWEIFYSVACIAVLTHWGQGI